MHTLTLTTEQIELLQHAVLTCIVEIGTQRERDLAAMYELLCRSEAK